jgi:hypothetical protein
MTQIKHPFEDLAPPPYKFVGIRDASEIAAKMEAAQSLYDKPEEGACIGSCHHCFAAITVGVKLKGSNGVAFVVGETCAKKAFQPEETIAQSVKKACNQRRTKIKNQRVSAEYEKALNWFTESEGLKSEPHPKGFSGLSLWDYLDWYQKAAGKKKFVDVCKNNGFKI